jgi:lipoprotein NlpD
MKFPLRYLGVAFVLGIALSGCMVAKKPAPVVERAPEKIRPVAKPKAAPPVDQRPDTYVVKRGDTLYGIALDHGQDFRDIARWSNLADPNAIEVGQVLRVRDPAASKPLVAAAPDAGTSPGGAVTTPYQAAPVVEGRTVGAQTTTPLPEQRAATAGSPDASVVSTPLAVKVPYSDAALAKLREAPSAPKPTPEATAAGTKPPTPSINASEETDGVAWSWPAKGTVIANFNENGGPKGVQIAGEMGQPVLASAGGRVVYTGSGLRGYGNLVIIKHNNTYLSAYAHNRAVLVKQGDNVSKGQKIAEMGNSDASRVMLHFEIRRLGKPVDPVKFLPPSS